LKRADVSGISCIRPLRILGRARVRIEIRLGANDGEGEQRAHLIFGRELPDDLGRPFLLRGGGDKFLIRLERNGIFNRRRRRIAQAFRRIRSRRAHEGEHFLRVLVALRRGKPEEQRRHPVVARHAATVGIHPAKAELRFRVPQAARLAVERDRVLGIPTHAFAVLVLPGQRAQGQRAIGEVVVRIRMRRTRAQDEERDQKHRCRCGADRATLPPARQGDRAHHAASARSAMMP
jgi:hypothetical protein